MFVLATFAVIGIAFLLGASAASIPAVSAAQKSDLTAAFVKDSVWKGNEVVTKPKSSTVAWQLTVIERDGEKLTAQLVSAGNFRRRHAMGRFPVTRTMQVPSSVAQPFAPIWGRLCA
jgi:hypothetical protein